MIFKKNQKYLSTNEKYDKYYVTNYENKIII